MTGYLVIGLIMLVPAIFGGILARNRGRNIAVWALLSAIFPIFLMVVYFEKPLRDVPGGFKRCPSCNEYNPWKATHCKYCSAEFSAPLL
jgi:hypothetical protein